MKNTLLTTLPIVFIVLMITVVPKVLKNQQSAFQRVTNFEECVAAGNPVMESYPRQCRYKDQLFVEDAVSVSKVLTEEQALLIAGNTKECTMAGIPKNEANFNANSQTWWIDLERMPELENDGCNPACVVWDQTREAKVNWRCTGLNPEPIEGEAVSCQPEQREAEVCTEIYQPVCATVSVQCIKAPCNPIKQTYENACRACANSLVDSYVSGECEK